MFQHKRMAAMMVYQINPLGFKLYFCANTFLFQYFNMAVGHVSENALYHDRGREECINDKTTFSFTTTMQKSFDPCLSLASSTDKCLPVLPTFSSQKKKQNFEEQTFKYV